MGDWWTADDCIASFLELNHVFFGVIGDRSLPWKVVVQEGSHLWRFMTLLLSRIYANTDLFFHKLWFFLFDEKSIH